LFISFKANCQTNIDSLKRILNKAITDTAKVNVLISISDIYRTNDPQKAFEYSQKAIELCQDRRPDKYSANAYMQLAICQIDLFEYKNALIYIDKAIAIFEKVKDYSNLVVALNTKGRIFDSQADYPKAIEYFTKALTLAKNHGNKNGMSICYLNLGLIYSYVDNIEKSYENIKNSIEIDSILNNKEAVATGYNNLGIIFAQTGDFTNALKFYSKAYEINLPLNNKYNQAKYLSNIGNIYYETKDYSKAIAHYTRSIKIKREISDKLGIANTYNNIGAAYLEINKTDSTLFYMRAALKIYTEINDQRYIAMTYANLGEVYHMLKNDTEALACINKSIVIRRKIGDISGEGHCYQTLGAIYAENNNSALALDYLNKAVVCSQKAKDEKRKMECYLKMSSIYEKSKNPSKALLYYQKYHAISDTIYNNQKQKLTLELQTKYETAAKDNEIKILNNNNEINRLGLEKSMYKLKRQQLFIGVIVFILLLSTCFGVFYFRLFKQKQKINQILEDQNTEIEQQNQEICTQRDYLEYLNKELEIQKEKVMNQRDSIEAELKKTLLASEILQRENIQFKFEALKNQLNPHFLFNTFSTLISLISENAGLAENYTRNLSNVYRYILTSKDKELVKLKEEIEFINSYMFLISIRFNDNVTIDINIEKEMLEYSLPLLSLQLLIENAVKHNVISGKKPLKITIDSEDNKLTIQNNLQKKSSIENSTKIGLQNIINRYELISSEKVDVCQSDTYFTVKLPLIKA
jgi:tetratricopeptide (TPR) repeat protein